MDARAGQERGDGRIDRRSGHLEVVGEAAVALDEQRTGTSQVAGGQGGDHGVDAGALGDDVARSAAEQRVAKADDVVGAGEAEGSDDGRCCLALGHPGGVAGLAQRAVVARVGDDHVDRFGERDVAGGKGGEVDQERVAGSGAGTGERIEQPDRCPDQVLGLLAEPGDHDRGALDAEHAGQGDGESGAGGQSGTDRQGGGDPDAPTGSRAGEGDDGGGQAGPGRLEGTELAGVGVDVDGDGRHLCEGVRGKLERGDGCRLEGGSGPDVDGHGQGSSGVVVGVVSDEVDPTGGPSVRHTVSMAPTGRLVRTDVLLDRWSRDRPPSGDARHECRCPPPGYRSGPTAGSMSGPLEGVRIVELAGIGPGPFAGMMLADAGADVIRIDRADGPRSSVPERPHVDLLNRGRRSVAVDLKHPDGVDLVLRLVEVADGLTEGFRPGVAERLGLGPEPCLERNPKLVYGRMTGWGQEGPLAPRAGHDIDYIAVAGALEPLGRAGDRPVPPLNLVGDFGGGGMLLAYGMVCALLAAGRTGEGQVVDAAMVDGAAALMTMVYMLRQAGVWRDERGTNLLDTGAHFYEVYQTADGGYLAVGAIEPQFYQALLVGLGLDGVELPRQMDREHWPEMKARFAQIFATKTRDQWEEVFAGTDACVAPVLGLAEAPEHPHNKARGTFVEVGGVLQPGPAPRFSRTPSSVRRPPPHPGQWGDEALTAWGVPAEEIAALRRAGAIV